MVVSPSAVEAKWRLLVRKHTIAFLDKIAGKQGMHDLLLGGSDWEAQSWPECIGSSGLGHAKTTAVFSCWNGPEHGWMCED